MKSHRVDPALSHQLSSHVFSLLPGLMNCWVINRPIGSPVRARPGTTLLFLTSEVGETDLSHLLALLCSS